MSYILEPYGTAADGTPLEWAVVSPTGSGPWPGAIVTHIGGFLGGTLIDGPLLKVAQDLANVGVICYSPGYRLDKQHVAGQTVNCYWPHQTDDCKMAVQSARIDSRCNGKVGAVGGSAGGTHAISVACEIGSSDVGPVWGPDDRVLAAIALSPPTQFDDRTPYPYLDDFVRKLSLYCNTTDLVAQHAMSPTAFMDETCSRLFIVAAETEQMPPAQFNAIEAKIAELGLANCESRFVPGSKHAFGNWNTVKGDAIPWFQAALT